MKSYTRMRVGKGFTYKSNTGETVSKEEIQRIKQLAIPPAWKHVNISADTHAKVLAEGLDAKGRRQAIYNPEFRAAQDEAKFSRILDFGQRLPALRKTVDRDMHARRYHKDKVVASMVHLIDEAYFRIGTTAYAQQNESYGLSTMCSRHVAVHGSTITFDFIGKSGKHHIKKIQDKTLANIIKHLDDAPGDAVFRYQEKGEWHDVSASDVNAYIHTYAGEEYSAKDFRTWAGTMNAVTELLRIPPVHTKQERKKAVTACVKKVASRLGNTPAVARASYIDPRVIEHFMHGKDFVKLQETIKTMRPRKYMGPEERCVLRLLK